jgi:hypothetical protein
MGIAVLAVHAPPLRSAWFLLFVAEPVPPVCLWLSRCTSLQPTLPPSLVDINLSGNAFSGEIPAEYGTSTVRLLSLSYNGQLAGACALCLCCACAGRVLCECWSCAVRVLCMCTCVWGGGLCASQVSFTSLAPNRSPMSTGL